MPLVPAARRQTLEPGLRLAWQDGAHTTGLGEVSALPECTVADDRNIRVIWLQGRRAMISSAATELSLGAMGKERRVHAHERDAT